KNFFKKLPKGSVVYELDKNTNRCFVECPVLLGRRIATEVGNNPAFLPVKISCKKILENWQVLFRKNDLEKFGRLKNGKVPNSFVIPKYKSPLDKSRLISSYFHHPLRNVFQTASK